MAPHKSSEQVRLPSRMACASAHGFNSQSQTNWNLLHGVKPAALSVRFVDRFQIPFQRNKKAKQVHVQTGCQKVKRLTRPPLFCKRSQAFQGRTPRRQSQTPSNCKTTSTLVDLTWSNSAKNRTHAQCAEWCPAHVVDRCKQPLDALGPIFWRWPATLTGWASHHFQDRWDMSTLTWYPIIDYYSLIMSNIISDDFW